MASREGVSTTLHSLARSPLPLWAVALLVGQAAADTRTSLAPGLEPATSRTRSRHPRGMNTDDSIPRPPRDASVMNASI